SLLTWDPCLRLGRAIETLQAWMSSNRLQLNPTKTQLIWLDTRQLLANRNRNRKLDISTAPTKAKSREPAYSQALNQNRIDRQRVKIQRVRQADSQTAKVDDA